MQERIAVIGSGVAGVSCARRLADKGFSVTIFDKGRQPSGRLATRQSGRLIFNHGAPSVHADRPAFAQVLERLASHGSAQQVEAAAPSPSISAQSHALSRAETTAYQGTPTMNALLAPLHDGIDVRQDHTVTALVEADGVWTVGLDGRAPVPGFHAIAITIPAPQAAGLAADHVPALGDHVSHVSYHAIATMMAAFRERLPIGAHTRLATGFDLAKQLRNPQDDPATGARDGWVVHADPVWSHANLSTDKDDIAAALFDRFLTANGLPKREPVYLRGHRWRYGRVNTPLGRSHIWAADKRLGLAGDWCLGPNAEHAFESGIALAEAMLASLGACSRPSDAA